MSLREEVERFLARFFGEGNDFTEEWYRTDARARSPRQWVNESLLRGGPALLPRKQGTARHWYALALDRAEDGAVSLDRTRAARDLRELLTAFFGVSYSDFSGAAHSLDPADPVEQAILDLTSLPVYRLEPGADFVRPLRLLFQVLQRAEIRPATPVRSTGRLLRDFHSAVVARDRRGGEEALQRLQTEQRLDALNLRFLEVKLWAGLEAWEEILAFEPFGTLKQCRRPPGVSRALIQAEYRVKLQPYEASGDVERAVLVFREEVRPTSGTLFEAYPGGSEPDVLKAFMLYAATAAPPLPALRDALLAAPEIPAADLTYLRRLASVIAAPEPEPAIDPLDSAARAMAENDFDRALGLAVAAPSSRQRAQVLLRCAREIGTNAAEQIASAAMSELPEADRDWLLQSRINQEIWSRIREMPDHWEGWLDRLSSYPWPPTRALQIAEQGSAEWGVHRLLESPERVTALEERLFEQADNPILSDALPHLVSFLQRDGSYPRREFTGIYFMVAWLMAEGGGAGTVADLCLFHDMCDAVLSLGCSRERYRDLLESAISLCRLQASGANLAGFLDIAELVSYYSCPIPELRTRFVEQVITRSLEIADAGRVEAEPWASVRRLAGEYGLADQVKELEPEELERTANEQEGRLASYRGMIAIYTLTESASIQVRKFLEQHSPDCQVELCHDKGGSPRLRALARNADIFVEVTRSAKHAATSFIEANRPSRRPLLRPRGRGASSILVELLGFLDPRSSGA